MAAFRSDEFELRRATFEDALYPGIEQEERRRLQAGGGRGTCPCCGYPTILGRGAYEICPICGWEDDGQDDPERAPRHGLPRPAAVVGGVNVDYSLVEARSNFAEYTTMFRPTDRDFERERAQSDVKRRIQSVYDRHVDGEVTFVEADAEARSLLDELL